MLKKSLVIIISALIISSFAACTGNAGQSSSSSSSASSVTSGSSVSADSSSSGNSSSSDSGEVTFSGYEKGIIDTTNIFTKRDLTQTADTSSAKTLEVSDGQTLKITEEGVYVIKGIAKNCTIRVEADDTAKVQLVLDGVSITNDSTPAIYVVSADKCFVTTGADSTLSVTGAFTADSDTNTDAVIFSKDDLVLNGTAALTINSAQGNGVTGKDDVKVTGGTYNITSALDSIEANDSIAIYDGTLTINSSKDGLHSENSDDDTKGYVYIHGGTFTINAKSDAVQATTYLQIDGGTFKLTAAEGFEATSIQINDGTIEISASDDGINGTQKSNSVGTPNIEINGGKLTIVMGQGDTDAIDCNGNITVNGGTIDITAQMSSFDYDGTATYNGGTIIINGQEVNSIPQSMMGGGGMGGRGGMGGQMGGQAPDAQNGNGFGGNGFAR